MRDYKAILGLVEEVRDLLHLNEAGGDKAIKGKFKKPTMHNPFKYLKKGKSLGAAVRGSTTVPGKQRGYWRCRCMSYTCHCKGSEGEKKIVRIDRGYKNTYNIAYRKYRKQHASKYAPGKKWIARPKKKEPKAQTP